MSRRFSMTTSRQDLTHCVGECFEINDFMVASRDDKASVEGDGKQPQLKTRQIIPFPKAGHTQTQRSQRIYSYFPSNNPVAFATVCHSHPARKKARSTHDKHQKPTVMNSKTLAGTFMGSLLSMFIGVRVKPSRRIRK